MNRATKGTKSVDLGGRLNATDARAIMTGPASAYNRSVGMPSTSYVWTYDKAENHEAQYRGAKVDGTLVTDRDSPPWLDLVVHGSWMLLAGHIKCQW